MFLAQNLNLNNRDLSYLVVLDNLMMFPDNFIHPTMSLFIFQVIQIVVSHVLDVCSSAFEIFVVIS